MYVRPLVPPLGELQYDMRFTLSSTGLKHIIFYSDIHGIVQQAQQVCQAPIET